MAGKRGHPLRESLIDAWIVGGLGLCFSVLVGLGFPPSPLAAAWGMALGATIRKHCVEEKT